MPFTLTGALLMDGSQAPAQGLLAVQGEKMDPAPARSLGLQVEIPDGVAFPGLINACDSLLGSVLPRFGRGPYASRQAWEEELKGSRAWDELQKLSPEDRILLGLYRQILSGVTTVFDPDWKVASLLAPEWRPIRIIEHFVRGHAFFPAMPLEGDDFSRLWKKAADEKAPFVVPVEEGTAKEVTQDVDYLHRRKALGKRTVLLHGVGCGPKNIEQCGHSSSHLVFCPSSEKFLYGRTADVPAFLKKGVSVSLGSDAPLAGGQALLEELKSARDLARFDWKKGLDARELVGMVTTAPAKAFGLAKIAGRLAKGAPADITVVARKKNADGWTSLVEAHVNDLHLVVAQGKPLLAKERYSALVKNSGVPGQKVSIHGEKYWLAGKPLDLKKRVEAALGAPPAWRFFPVGV